jgi:glycosyltransferase involved in cell wall biosynthesis
MNLNLLWDYLYSIKLSKILISYHFDAIYTNTRIIFISGFVAKRLHIPNIIHSREFIKENMLRTAWGAEHLINRLSTKVIVISDIMKKSFMNLDSDKLILIYNGLPKPKNVLNKIFQPKGCYHALITGTLIPAKGQLDAVQAIGILRSEGIDNIMLHIIGSDPDLSKPDSYKRTLEDQIDKLGISNSVIFHGEIQNIEQFRKDMDIELVCSLCEPFGRVTVEAMQNNLVVIGADAGATPEIIKNGFNGLLYEVNNERDLAMKIKMVINDCQMANKLIANAYEFTKQNFTEEKTVKDVYELVENLI